MGRNRNRNEGPVLVKMENLNANKELMKNRRLLEGTKIYVDNVLTWTERDIQVKLW